MSSSISSVVVSLIAALMLQVLGVLRLYRIAMAPENRPWRAKPESGPWHAVLAETCLPSAPGGRLTVGHPDPASVPAARSTEPFDEQGEQHRAHHECDKHITLLEWWQTKTMASAMAPRSAPQKMTAR